MATATATKPKKKSASKINFRPLDDRLLIRQAAAEDKTQGGIILPDAAREKPQYGKVIAAGPGKMLDSGNRGTLSVKVGDEVYYGKYAGTEIEIDGEKFVICRENDLLAVVA